MMTEALTFFTKGRAEFYLDGVRRGDRVPGILSSEHDVVGQGGTFELRYVEPTTRVCIPSVINKDQQPVVTKVILQPGETLSVTRGFKALVCLGQIMVGDRTFDEEQTISVTSNEVTIKAAKYSMLLDFSHSHAPR